jgi:hypothetical protein
MNSTLSEIPALLFLVAPWLLLGLVLSGPFLALLTVMVVIVAAMALVAGVAAILAAPIVLVHRHRRSVRHPRPSFELQQVTA